jgi:hypothetical protein
MSNKEEMIVKIFRITLNPSMKLKMQLKMEIKDPANKKVLELIFSNEISCASSVRKNLNALLNQLKRLRNLFTII